MDRRTLDRLRNRYPGSSWALWSDGFPDEGCVEEDPDALVEFVESNRDRLEPGVVLLGLNPSGELPDSYANFHSPKAKHFDDRLKEFVQENGLDNIAGAYMTDIVPDEVDPDFGNVSPEEADVDRLLDQLEILGRDRFDVVTFSGKAFEILRDCFDAEAAEGCHRISSFSTTWNDATLRVYRVWFYGNWGANADKVPELERQLEHLNDAVAEQVG